MPGASDLLGLGKGIYENIESTYDMEEKKIIDSHFEIRRLVENLEQNKDVNEDQTQ